ncbi:MAG TPA: indolepyruvate ferredoxin oxidoreductase, partial [Methanomicrobia archaeon]|nr:indolepyruvate ferredoxin oxidoreductase [Methanomicrobia archaeon]HEX59499.1 indolepyruvate ferredoxin oxidoreductase [Methanomicrobia archaeon]
MLITLDEPGREVLLMGNEAIARGAIEAGVAFCSAYPGTPSSEILGVLAEAAPKLGFYAEWSTNEIVAMEAAAAASFSGLRALCAMKSQGLSVCADFLTTLNLSGTKGGMVIVVCDDPAALSSVNEIDTRSYAEIADLPLLEPATVQEAKDMTKFAFELSEELQEPCIVRSVTRISHGRGNVRLGEINKERRAAQLSERFITGLAASAVERHAGLHEKLRVAAEKFEGSPFNFYYGDPDAAFLIITSGAGWLYSKEALQLLDLKEGFGILKLGTTHPLPRRFVASHLEHAAEALVIEETDPFIERKVKALAADLGLDVRIYGREPGSERAFADAVGEMSVDAVIEALRRVKNVEKASFRDAEYEREAEEALKMLPRR